MTYVASWARAFVLTVVVELLVAGPLLAGHEPARLRRAGLILVANLCTHPLVWFVLPEVLPAAAYLPVAEAWAVLGEVGVYALTLPRPRPARLLAISVAANGASLAVGLALRAWLGIV